MSKEEEFNGEGLSKWETKKRKEISATNRLY